jgi:hypothetical protein
MGGPGRGMHATWAFSRNQIDQDQFMQRLPQARLGIRSRSWIQVSLISVDTRFTVSESRDPRPGFDRIRLGSV